MKILIAEDDPDSRQILNAVLTKWGHEVVIAEDGLQALASLQSVDAPQLAILDVMMPNMDGTDVCRSIRQTQAIVPPYIILLTALAGKHHVVAGIEAGADDYMTKPFDLNELKVRVKAGIRMVELQSALAERVQELEDALASVNQLQGLLPICSYCKSIRDDQNYWQELETYVVNHSEAQFSHSICPNCYSEFVQPALEELGHRREREQNPGNDHV